MKSVIFILGLLISSSSFADYTFQCFESSGKNVAIMTLSSETWFQEDKKEVCNGGVGDPMVCETVIYLYQYRKWGLEFQNAPKKSLLMPVKKMTWKEGDHDTITGFYGKTLWGSKTLVVGSTINYGNFPYTISIYDKNFQVLNCR